MERLLAARICGTVSNRLPKIIVHTESQRPERPFCSELGASEARSFAIPLLSLQAGSKLAVPSKSHPRNYFAGYWSLFGSLTLQTACSSPGALAVLVAGNIIVSKARTPSRAMNYRPNFPRNRFRAVLLTSVLPAGHADVEVSSKPQANKPKSTSGGASVQFRRKEQHVQTKPSA
jgi:hypothetical protein